MDKTEFEERAAIKEYDGNMPREEAEKQAFDELTEIYYQKDVEKINNYKE